MFRLAVQRVCRLFCGGGSLDFLGKWVGCRDVVAWFGGLNWAWAFHVDGIFVFWGREIAFASSG